MEFGFGQPEKSRLHPPWSLCGMCKAGWQREERGPFWGIPHLRWVSWVQTNTAIHNPEERRLVRRVSHLGSKGEGT